MKKKKLKERIKAIRYAKIKDIKIPYDIVEYIENKYRTLKNSLNSLDLRDVEKFVNIAKTFALLNFLFRKRDGENLLLEKENVDIAFELWSNLSKIENMVYLLFIAKFMKKLL